MSYRNRLVRRLAGIALLAVILGGPVGLFLLTARARSLPPVTATATPSITPHIAAIYTPPTPVPPSFAVVISEIAWAGTAASADDEWIELLNRRDYAVNLSGWLLRARDGDPVIHLTGIIPAHGFFLLERGDDRTISNIRADQIYQGALSDAGERLFLYNRSGKLVDHANASSDSWLAGALFRHRSMERSNLLADKRTSWATHNSPVMNGLDANGRVIRGTPHRRNSIFFAGPTSTPFSGGLPDLRISYMKIEFENVGCWPPGGNPLGLRIWVLNGGRVGARNFVVSMENEQDRGQRTILELGARQYAQVFFRHEYLSPPLVRGEVDSTGLVRESNEGNNVIVQIVPMYTFTPPAPCVTRTPTGTPTIDPTITPTFTRLPPGGSAPAD